MKGLSTRQLCFFFAFLLPISKLLETPSLLAYYTAGDLLLPAIIQLLLQGGMVAFILFLTQKIGVPFFTFTEKNLGRFWGKFLLVSLAVFYLFFTILPVLELERFVYGAFFDTAPSIAVFFPFFLLSAYISSNPLHCFSRILDLCMPLFLVSFFPLLAMSVGQAKFTSLLPLFSAPPRSVSLGVLRSSLHFSDTAFLLPLLGNYTPRKGEIKKLLASYTVGAFFLLIFLATFYGVFGALSPQRPFAFDNIAQYFGGLAVIGRIDLLLVYVMTILLLFYYSLPLLLCVQCFSKATNAPTLPVALITSGGLMLFTLYGGRLYPSYYSLVTTKLIWTYPLFAYAVPFITLLWEKRKTGRERRLA